MELFITAVFDEAFDLKYAVATYNKKGDIEVYKNDRNVYLYQTVQEAEAGLAEILKTKADANAAEPFSDDELREFLQKYNSKFRFARTYASFDPHEYCLKKYLDEAGKRAFERFVAKIKKEAVDAYYYKHCYKCLIFDGYFYWAMGYEYEPEDIINRSKANQFEQIGDHYRRITKK